MKMMVIADDFTGSNDTGVQLAKKGARTEVMLSASQKPSRRADVLVINTESRAMPADQAASAVYAALSPWCETSPAPLVYKKIDSTFRGNIGAEVTAAMRASQRKLAVIPPRSLRPDARRLKENVWLMASRYWKPNLPAIRKRPLSLPVLPR